MKFIDFFSGMGTARMGFEQAGHVCVYSVEWDKHKRRIYGVIFGKEPEGRDIREVRANELPRADCWIAGFPCQDISVAGNQLGFDGDRSSLYFEVMRLLQETPDENKPSFLLFENVKNFFSVNGGRDFLTALIAMDEVGYDAEWDLLNSKNFGVPQNRERVFIAGHLRESSTGKVFPITKTNRKTGNEINIIAHREGFRRNMQVYDINGSIEALDTGQGGGRHPHIQTPILMTCKDYKETELSNTLLAGHPSSKMGNKTPVTGVLVRAVLTPERSKIRQMGRRIKEDGEPMFTLTKQDIHDVEIKIIDDTQGFDGIREYTENAPTLRSQRNGLKTVTQSRIRRLTPRECMRLQGVDDKVTDKLIEAGISDTQLYRAAGDAWSVPVGYEIARRMVC